MSTIRVCQGCPCLNESGNWFFEDACGLGFELGRWRLANGLETTGSEGCRLTGAIFAGQDGFARGFNPDIVEGAELIKESDE